MNPTQKTMVMCHCWRGGISRWILGGKAGTDHCMLYQQQPGRHESETHLAVASRTSGLKAALSALH